MSATPSGDICLACEKRVYANECVALSETVKYHKICYKCSEPECSVRSQLRTLEYKPWCNKHMPVQSPSVTLDALSYQGLQPRTKKTVAGRTVGSSRVSGGKIRNLATSYDAKIVDHKIRQGVLHGSETSKNKSSPAFSQVKQLRNEKSTVAQAATPDVPFRVALKPVAPKMAAEAEPPKEPTFAIPKLRSVNSPAPSTPPVSEKSTTPQSEEASAPVAEAIAAEEFTPSSEESFKEPASDDGKEAESPSFEECDEVAMPPTHDECECNECECDECECDESVATPPHEKRGEGSSGESDSEQ